ncbi:hypothetical protein PPERSA_11218 [Pseudocohnilembus persalinus]|uniref:Uncharacterized protein n=1 Tax=Pseudocohnilembus persalinus TaxID=266149 RepID=A0A0V0R0H1_PSEPJ|nr:hypothetical protein PPERSA_11218 [Pseudocohnilembus persalinus]|eukprot:KRX07669.1 hypothetical protein PPERSA_11218 [Pseudocohnilembus persalinus]
MSSYLHTFFCKDEKTNIKVKKYDYCGIAQLAYMKGFSFFYYALYNDQQITSLYFCIWTALWCLIFTLCCFEKFHDEKHKPYKVTLIVFTASLILVPFFHTVILGDNPFFINKIRLLIKTIILLILAT